MGMKISAQGHRFRAQEAILMDCTDYNKLQLLQNAAFAYKGVGGERPNPSMCWEATILTLHIFVNTQTH